MNSFFGLFFATLLMYVQADPHECAPWAADIQLKADEKHPNPHGNQIIPYERFAQNPTEAKDFYIFWATVDTKFDEFDDFCSALTHGVQCGNVYYQSKISNPNDLWDGEKPKYQRKTHFYAQNVNTKKLTAYSIEMKLVDTNDYIFEAIEGSFEAFTEGSKTPATIPPEIKNVLNSTMALYRSEKGYSIYITCDAKHAWVGLETNADADTVEDEVASWLNELAKINVNGKSFDPYRKNAYLISANYSPKWVDKFGSVIPPLIEAR